RDGLDLRGQRHRPGEPQPSPIAGLLVEAVSVYPPILVQLRAHEDLSSDLERPDDISGLQGGELLPPRTVPPGEAEAEVGVIAPFQEENRARGPIDEEEILADVHRHRNGR